MKKVMNCTKNTIVLGIILFLLSSCSNELTIQMPNGPAGPAGASAYDVWVQAVKAGVINWDANLTDINNYFLYLKGQDGQNGSNGKDAYQLWVDAVANGIDDPHNPGQQWPKDETTLQDFWYFLTGAKGQDGAPPYIGANGYWFIDGIDTGIPAKGQDGQNGQNGADGQNGSVITIGANDDWFIDGTDTGVKAFGQNGAQGQSAYDLWVQEVTSLAGIEDPHNPGHLWPKDKTTTQDFWDFLRGNDGKPGETEQPGGETGQPGGDIKIILGKANVIPLYVNQSYNEFVRWEDGGVGYIVYNDVGDPAAGAEVKGLPGIKDPGKIYIADANGFFLVPKEDLPDNENISMRRGTALVTYTNSQSLLVNNEISAPNTYVPNRMYVRLRLQTDPDILDGTYMRCRDIVVERETDGGVWQQIPAYLGDLRQRITAYALTDQTDPASYNTESYSTDIDTINISISSTMRINRLRKRASYYHPVTTSPLEWDGNDHYFTLVLKGYYGETPQTATVIKMAPVQAMPMITNVEAFNYSPPVNAGDIGYFGRITGMMDISGATIDNSLLFKSTLETQSLTTSGGSPYTYYYPATDDRAAVDNLSQFRVTFLLTSSFSTYDYSPSISNPNFSIGTPRIGSSVVLACSGSYFYPLNTIGYLRFASGTDGDTGTLTIMRRTTTVNGWRYDFPDMPVSYTSE